ncbi:MAG: hypothetical protein COW65_14465 [Cytophagales bacterium CG18_big_fil_WC_8_21_14_2_50_42_9]|nr:MAG: hypothetical protein COW65_14465 [Cytophagales bacterium CG18_big_fil_WC_8_21_14_2_50_42_9]
MKRLMLIPFFAIIALTSCEKANIAPGVPACAVKQIKEFKKESSCDDGAVAEYKFQNKTVYVLSDGNCIADGGSQVIDSDCNYLGYLGGLVGSREINGVDFASNATFI